MRNTAVLSGITHTPPSPLWSSPAHTVTRHTSRLAVVEQELYNGQGAQQATDLMFGEEKEQQQGLMKAASISQYCFMLCTLLAN